ncbi:hypothetical protein LCGC14_3121160, partial [marine sediment metagenome]
MNFTNVKAKAVDLFAEASFVGHIDDEYEYEKPEGDGTELEEIAETIWVT